MYGTSITYMKWDLKLKNLDSVVAVRRSDTVTFPQKNLSGERSENEFLFFLLTSMSADLLCRTN